MLDLEAGLGAGWGGNVIDSDRSLMTDPLPLPGARPHSDTLKFSLQFQGNRQVDNRERKAEVSGGRGSLHALAFHPTPVIVA